MVTLDPVKKDAPWEWIKAAIDDMVAAPTVSLSYGVAFMVVGLSITMGLWALGMGGLVPVFAGGFALVGPAFAVGIYRVSQMREAGEVPQMLDFWSIPTGRLTQIALLSVLLMVFFLVWARLAQFMFAMFAHGSNFQLDAVLPFLFTEPSGIILMVLGTAIGAVLGLAAFSVSALSFPMMIDQDVDVITAIVASIKAVKDQPMVMFTWAWLIAFCTAAGLAVFLVGIAVTFPLIAHASWHAYKAFNPRPLPSAKELEAASSQDA